MYCRVNKCCFCWSLRWGIILFACINMLFSLFAMGCMMVTTELDKVTFVDDVSLEMVTTTVLFAILGMGVILNALLLAAEYEKDIKMLKLYRNYEAATTLASLLPICILLSRLRFVEACTASFAIAMKLYVIILVRSEILKLEQKTIPRVNEVASAAEDVVVAISDRESLI